MSAQRFAEDLAELDTPATEADGLMVFQVEIVAGALAGNVTEVGVEVAELGGWPLVHPHWLHLPGDVQLQPTNAQSSSKPGWRRHSRQQSAPSRSARAGADWLAHVRGVLTAARTA